MVSKKTKEVTGWVVPVCGGVNSNWVLLPRIYKTKALATSGTTKRKSGRWLVGRRTLPPIKVTIDCGEIASCDSCPNRFDCYTTKDEFKLYL